MAGRFAHEPVLPAPMTFGNACAHPCGQRVASEARQGGRPATA